MARTLVATDHPAKWSQPILDVIAIDVITPEAIDLGRPVRVLDPFAGVGRGRLAEALGDAADQVVGIELQPEWGDHLTMTGNATDLDASWSGHFDAVVTSPCYGNRMADHHDAADPCTACGGTGRASNLAEFARTPLDMVPEQYRCRTCKGSGLSWRNTYAHSLRRQGADLMPGSAAAMQWGPQYRELHKLAMSEMLRVVREDGLLVVNMSNHIRAGREELVVEWWLGELLYRQCSVVEVRRVRTRRQRNGANAEARVDGEVVIVLRTPNERRLL